MVSLNSPKILFLKLVRRKAKEGIPQKKLADMYGVKFGCVSKIVLRTRWKTI